MDKLDNHEEIVQLMQSGKKIEAIKLVQVTSRKSLRECKEYVDNIKMLDDSFYESSQPHIIKESKTPQPQIVRCPECGCSQITTDTKKILGIIKTNSRSCTVCRYKF